MGRNVNVAYHGWISSTTRTRCLDPGLSIIPLLRENAINDALRVCAKLHNFRACGIFMET